METSDPTILAELKRIINTKDGKKYTALHYATQLWSQETVKISFLTFITFSTHFFSITGSIITQTRVQHWNKKCLE